MTRRVLQVLGRSAGGIARHVAQITQALDGADGLAVDIACPPDLPIAMPKEPIPLHIPDGVTGHPGAIRALRSIVKSGGYHCVHAHGLRAGIDSALASRSRVTTMTTVHNLVRTDIAGRRAPFDRLAEPLVVRLSHRTLAVSEEIARRLREAAPSSADRIEVLYLGIGDPPPVGLEREAVRDRLGIAPGQRLAVTVARLAPQKALPVMFGAVAEARTPLRLVVLGEGPMESELRDLVAERGWEDRIQLLGFRDDVHDIVAAADVFCLSSIWEGVPLAAQEAILLGVPIVSTDVGGMGELITDRVSGRLVPSGDRVALAAAIDEVCGSAEIASSYVDRARDHLQTRFSTTRMLERLAVFYREDGGAR